MHPGLQLLAGLLVLQDPPTLVLAHGADARHLQIDAVDETPTLPRSMVLDEVEFLPLDISARTSLWQWHPSRPHLGRVASGPARVELPAGGALLKYRRAGTTYGFLLVTARGRPRVLVERPGIGATATDPFGRFLGIATDGSCAAVDTPTELLLLRLDGADFSSTAAPARVVQTSARPRNPSLLLGPTKLFFQTEERRLYRCATTDLAQPVEVPLAAVPPAVLEAEMAIAGDGGSVAVLSGADVEHLEVAVVGTTGGPLVVSDHPGRYLAPGYLPADARGPHMALSDDGRSVAFTEGGLREDFWFVPAVGTTPAQLVNTTANFNPYVDVGVFFIFLGPVLTLGLGDDADAVDLYRVNDGGPAGPVVRNLTQTSGMSVPPFGGRPTLDLAAVYRGPGSTVVVEHRTGEGLELLQVDPLTGLRRVLASALPAPTAAQSSGPGQFPDLIASSPVMSRLLMPSASGFVEGFTLPGEFPVRRSAQRAVDGTRLISIGLLPGVEIALIVPLPWAVLPIRTTPTQAALWSSGGGLLLTESTPAGVVSDYYSTGPTVRLGAPSPFTLVLNNAGF
jgi:hypothetical protein